jgi:tetratricopeptide (TPR) repeat protein
MSEELKIDFLTVSRYGEPPVEASTVRALATSGLGAAEYMPRNESSSGGRQRLGAYHINPPGVPARARVNVSHHNVPVTSGMSEMAFNAITRGLVAEDTQTLREGTIALDIRIFAQREQALIALDWATQVMRVLLDLTQGTAIDPAAQRSYGRAEIAHIRPHDPLGHVAMHRELWDAESHWLHSHGLQKFGRPELDLAAVPHSLEEEGWALLREVANLLAHGGTLVAGQEIDFEEQGRLVAVGALPDADHQAPFGRLRLCDAALPGEGEPVGAGRLLARMAMADALRRTEMQDIVGALEILDRVLAANPDDCTALTSKAAIYLRGGNAAEALNLGELMELRVPGDYRGPLTVGQSLAAMGRYREALVALDRAILREPDAAESFDARARVHDRLGHTQPAATDHAHAAYLQRQGAQVV